MIPALALAVALGLAPHQGRAQDDSAAVLLTRIEAAATAVDRGAIVDLGAPDADQEALALFATTLTWPPVSRIIIKERDRTAQDDRTLAVLWEVFIERGIEGRVTTWQAVLSRATSTASWQIRRIARLSMASGLFRLSLDRTRQFEVRGLAVRGPDLAIDLPSGSLFYAATPGGPTAVVLLGRGRMRFAPPDASERTQVRIFSGHDVLESDFDAAFIRVRPADFESVFKAAALTPRAVNEGALRRAAEVFDEYVGRTLQVDLGDLSRERWSLTPQADDLIAEIRTRKHGSLTYARSGGEAEDVALFERRRRRNISIYASAEKLAARGRFYSDDDLVDYDVLVYDIETEFDPRRLWFDGNARIKLRIRAPAINTLTLKLADPLVVRGIYSPGLGRLLHLRTVGQNSVLVNLPATIVGGTDLWLNVLYSGRLEQQELDREALQIRQESQEPGIPLEPRFMYSNRSYWYPQSTVTDYATLTLRITVPADFDVVASGDPVGTPVPPPGVAEPGQRPRKMYVFTSREPLRYLACAVSRFTAVATAELVIPPKPSSVAAHAAGEIAASAPGPSGAEAGSELKLYVQANPRQLHRARGLTETAKMVFGFYASIIGDAPYPSFTLAVSESDLPGGHSPAYFAVLNQSLPGMPTTWRNDPVSFDEYPNFFLAHEMAHQWWGQAVGWKNYHEQWISEGFAQYFAALYGQKEQGDDGFTDILRQMRSTAMQASSQGPIYLGYRLGHIKAEGRVFRSLVYNKGAMVLHMLRRLIGDEAFFTGLRSFYDDWRFRKAGTDDFRKAMERASGRDLARYFEDWIFGDLIPSVSFDYTQVNERSAILRFEQRGTPAEFPLTVKVNYASGQSEEIVVALSERLTERAIELKSRLRSIDVNADHAALAKIDR
jgi:Peptidase family M1 domain